MFVIGDKQNNKLLNVLIVRLTAFPSRSQEVQSEIRGENGPASNSLTSLHVLLQVLKIHVRPRKSKYLARRRLASGYLHILQQTLQGMLI